MTDAAQSTPTPRKPLPTMHPLRKPNLRLSTTFGLGFFRPAPGTWGSLPPVVIAGVMILLGLGPVEAPFIYNGVLILILLVFSVACVKQGDMAIARFRREDPSEVVADETAGMSIALLALPLTYDSGLFHMLFLLGFAFLLFRGLDIAKSWPMSALERIPGGWGILLDDIAAGIITLIAIQMLLR